MSVLIKSAINSVTADLTGSLFRVCVPRGMTSRIVGSRSLSRTSATQLNRLPGMSMARRRVASRPLPAGMRNDMRPRWRV